MSPIVDVRYDAENNIHPRNLHEIIEFADKGLCSKQNASTINTTYKIRTGHRTEKMVFGTIKTISYYRN